MRAYYFSEIKKFNPYHGKDGRFTTSSGNATGRTGLSGDSGAGSIGISENVRKYGFDTNDGTSCAENVTHPAKISGVQRGEPMNFAQADEQRANPRFSEDSGRRINCQTCVVAYELRRRGYDVQANRRNIYNENYDQKKMASDSTWSWKDPKTGKHPSLIHSATEYDSTDAAYAYLNNTIQSGKRYTLEFSWGDGRGSHIITAEKTNGLLWLFDPQSGVAHVEENEVKSYIKNIAGIGTQPRNPRWPGGAMHMLPVSDMNIDEFAVETVLSKSTS